ncbi:MAG: GspE/PulE/PilB domain-containing protein, partial [Planctomycetota bacterium]
MAKQRKRLGEILYKAGLVEKQALIEAIKASKSNNKRLGQVLLDQGLIDEETLTKAIAKQFELEYINLDTTLIPSDAAKFIPQELIRRHSVLPLGMDNGKLRVIISDPLDLEMMDAIRFRLNTELECCLANPAKIRSYIQESFNQVKKEDGDRLKHSIDATAAELAEVGHELQAEMLRAQAAGEDDSAPI